MLDVAGERFLQPLQVDAVAAPAGQSLAVAREFDLDAWIVGSGYDSEDLDELKALVGRAAVADHGRLDQFGYNRRKLYSSAWRRTTR